jgi:anti-sigma B factor antagonist
LKIDTQNQNSWHLVRVDGEVDLNSSPTLRKAILGGIDGNKKVGVDLAGASYMDSSGVATLVEGLKRASEKKKSFALIRPSSAVTKVLQLARLDALFDIRDNLPGE